MVQYEWKELVHEHYVGRKQTEQMTYDFHLAQMCSQEVKEAEPCFEENVALGSMKDKDFYPCMKPINPNLKVWVVKEHATGWTSITFFMNWKN